MNHLVFQSTRSFAYGRNMGKNNENSQKSHIQHDQNHSSDRLSIDDNILRYRSNCQQSTSYVSDKPKDLDLLTPNHLLLGRYNSGAVIE